MNKLIESDIHLKLLINEPIYLEQIGNFKSPKIKEIARISETEYNYCLSMLLFDKSSINDDSIQNISNFDVIRSILAYDESFREYFMEGLRMHLDTTVNFAHSEEYTYISFGSDENEVILTEEMFEYLVELIRLANKIEKTDEDEKFNAANELAKKMIRERKEKLARLNAATKPKVTLHSIISGVSILLNNLQDIGELTIYQLYESNTRLHLIESIRNTNHGIYAGTVDGSKIKSEELDFTGVIHIKK